MRVFQWGLNNPVAVNLIMALILLLGLGAAFQVKREMFPQFSIDIITVSVLVEDGSTPEQVDQNIVQLLLPAIKQVNGVKEMRSSASSGKAFVEIEVLDNFDAQIVKQNIKDEIDRIENFPEKTKEPKVVFLEQFDRAINVAIQGKNVSDLEIREAADFLKQSMQNHGIANEVEVFAPRSYEISIYIPTKTLEAKNLRLEDIAQQIRANNQEFQTGEIRTEKQNIILKSQSRKRDAERLGQIPIQITDDEWIYLQDLAGKDGIVDHFSESNIIREYSGKKAVILEVKKTSRDDIIDLCKRVRDFVEKTDLGPGIKAKAIHDISEFVKDRLSLIIRNGLSGLALIILILSIFLEWQTAFWTAMGIGFSLIGTLGFLYMGGQSINMISLFAFLMSMGIIVDDAIVMGEGYFHHKQHKKARQNPALMALREVAWPIVAMMCTTIIAFVPLLFVKGIMGKFIYVMPIVIITTLVLSLFEALFILPAHLAHHCGKEQTFFMRFLSVVLYPFILISKYGQPLSEKIVSAFAKNCLDPLIRICVYHRYAVALIFAALLISFFGLIPAGIVKTAVFPDSDPDFHIAEMKFDIGTPIEETEKSTRVLVQSLIKTANNFEKSHGVNPLNEYFFQIGHEGSHAGFVMIELLSSDKGRNVSGRAFLDQWRMNTPQIPNIASLQFGAARGGPRGKPVEIIFYAEDASTLDKAKDEFIEYLKGIEGVVDIRSSQIPAAPTIEVQLKPEYQNLNLDEADLSRFIANNYQGIKVDSFYRNENEVKVYLRARPEERTDLWQLKEMHIPGKEMTLGQIAELKIVKEAGQIQRFNSRRALTVEANIEESLNINASEVRQKIEKEFLTKVKDVSWSYSGEAEDGQEAFKSMFLGYIPALFAIYWILASLFRSYIQPIIIMAAIPFSFIGVIAGHYIMGLPLTIISVFGIVALTGIAVNDSLVLIDYINEHREQKLIDTLVKASCRRFRPILLTSLTTIASMAPILSETSFQAQILIPMVVSIVFGLISTTFLILLLIPVAYMIVEDLLNYTKRVLGSKKSV